MRPLAHYECGHTEVTTGKTDTLHGFPCGGCSRYRQEVSRRYSGIAGQRKAVEWLEAQWDKAGGGPAEEQLPA